MRRKVIIQAPSYILSYIADSLGTRMSCFKDPLLLIFDVQYGTGFCEDVANHNINNWQISTNVNVNMILNLPPKVKFTSRDFYL